MRKAGKRSKSSHPFIPVIPILKGQKKVFFFLLFFSLLPLTPRCPAFRTTFEITLWKQRVFLCLKHWFLGGTQGWYTKLVHKASKTRWIFHHSQNIFLPYFYITDFDLFLESCPFGFKGFSNLLGIYFLNTFEQKLTFDDIYL